MTGKETLRQIIEGLEGVTPGPWYQTGTPWFNDGTGVLAGSPDGNIAFVIADTDDWSMPRDEYEGFPLGDKEADAEHIARCHPDAMRAIAEYVAALEADLDAVTTYAAVLEAERDELKAGIKRLSDEEELINETGRDGMLTAVHIGARLAEAEELARVMEAEANQMREVSISHRNRAEALEESLKTVLASLVATTSLIIRAEDLKVKPSKAVASDKMFTQMLKDYDKATIAGRAALKGDS